MRTLGDAGDTTTSRAVPSAMPCAASVAPASMGVPSEDRYSSSEVVVDRAMAARTLSASESPVSSASAMATCNDVS